MLKTALQNLFQRVASLPTKSSNEHLNWRKNKWLIHLQVDPNLADLPWFRLKFCTRGTSRWRTSLSIQPHLSLATTRFHRCRRICFHSSKKQVQSVSCVSTFFSFPTTESGHRIWSSNTHYNNHNTIMRSLDDGWYQPLEFSLDGLLLRIFTWWIRASKYLMLLLWDSHWDIKWVQIRCLSCLYLPTMYPTISKSTNHWTSARTRVEIPALIQQSHCSVVLKAPQNRHNQSIGF